MITCTGNCPHCRRDYELVPDRFAGDPPVFPVGGVCNHCNARLAWEPGDTYLSKFEPDDTVRGESPTTTVTFTPKERDQ